MSQTFEATVRAGNSSFKWLSFMFSFISASPLLTIQNASNVSIVKISPLDYAVLRPTPDYDPLSQPFPPNAVAPSIQIFDDSFSAILGDSPNLQLLASNNDTTGGAFAHEGATWDPQTDLVFFLSNADKYSGPNEGNHISSLSLRAFFDTGNANVRTVLKSADSPLKNFNGATNYGSQIVIAAQGQNTEAGGLLTINTSPPHKPTVMLNNFYGRQFNSPNDIVVHPESKHLFFTDTIYGHAQGFRPPYALPQQVYRFDPKTGSLSVICDGFVAPNGIAFNQAGDVAYITDTGQITGRGPTDYTLPATIYAFDVLPTQQGQKFTNRRVFAYVDFGIPDGLKVDDQGNLYAGCNDGVHVFNSAGTLVGKFFLGTTASNMVFAGPGKLVILAETEIWLASIAVKGILPVDLA